MKRRNPAPTTNATDAAASSPTSYTNDGLVMHPSKAKGAAAEREAARILSDLLGYNVKRRHNIGTHEDIGDLIGLPETTVQVCSRSTDVVAVGVVRKPLEVEQQARNAGTTYAATMLRIRGGEWRIVLTVPQWCTLWREAVTP